jgi:hypothetical protein
MGEVRWLGKRQGGQTTYYRGDPPGEEFGRESDSCTTLVLRLLKRLHAEVAPAREGVIVQRRCALAVTSPPARKIDAGSAVAPPLDRRRSGCEAGADYSHCG